MKPLLNSTVAALGFLALSACQPASDPVETGNGASTDITTGSEDISGRDLAQKLLSGGFKAEANESFGVEAFTALADTIPGDARFTFGNVTTADNGATVVEDFTFVVAVDGIDLGLKAETAEFWNFNTTALNDRLAGTNTADSIKLADRIEFSNISSVGFDELGARIAEEYNDKLALTIDPSGELLDPASMMVIREYDVRAEKLVLDGLTLEPFEVSYTDSDDLQEDELEGIHMLQAIAAASRAFSLNGFAMQEAEFVMDMGVGDQGLKMDMSVPTTIMSDYRRGDMGYAAYFDTRFDMDGVLPVDDPNFDEHGIPMALKGGIQSYEISDLRLANVYRAVSEWKMPEHTEADFMSLGHWRLENYRFEMSDETVFNADLIDLNLTKFHWLLPTEVSLDLDGFAYEIGTLLKSVFEMMPEEEIPAEELAQMQTVMTVLADNNLDCLCGDYDLKGTWDETTGAITYTENGNFADLFSSFANVDLTLTTPAQTAAALTDAVGEEAFETQIKEAFEFRNAVIRVTDNGGLEATLTAAHEIGKAFPDEPQMAMLAYNDATALRGFAVNAVRGFGPELAKDVPEVRPWVDAAALWLEEGGTLELKVAPETPITFETIETFDETDPEPGEVITRFGINLTHTPSE
ncbi:hypothetical protein RYZ27_00710 [Hyphomonas sp. FCG-A18]|jgi:hypothetical protein|uniref:hypothetical protein n=1 Tax=Hyphomonas sp. FCG-A18 TaxID=3080019 RepID=UPI002B2DA026|nr:hypothetical protein RYZ27_00710 [Hyphomonas sp. FCG-A18]